MSMRKILIVFAIAWLVAITSVHAWLNLYLFDSRGAATTDHKKFRIGFLPVTCHLDSPGYLEKRDRIFQLMGMSLRVGETAA